MKSELDIFNWKDYSIFRIIEKMPFPSPRVWDSNRGVISDLIKLDTYNKKFYFFDDFPEINYGLRSKYENKFYIQKDNKQIPKADGTLGKSGSIINFFKEKKIEIASCKIDLNLVFKKNGFTNVQVQEAYFKDLDWALNKIYEICINSTNLDCGYSTYTENNFSLSESENNGKNAWAKINANLDFNAQRDDWRILLNQYIEQEFNFSYQENKIIGEKIRNRKWLLEMFKYSLKEEIWNKVNSNEGEVRNQIEKAEELDLIKKTNSTILKKNEIKSSSNNEDEQFNNIPQFEPSKAEIPLGFDSFGNEIEELIFALNNPHNSIRSFFNDCLFIDKGIWSEETLFCEAFDENLYGNLIKEYHKYSLAQLRDNKSEELKKAERRGAGIGAGVGLISSAGLFAPFTAVLGANIGKMFVNNQDANKPLKEHLPDPHLLFAKDEGSFTSLKRRYQMVTPKRRICMRKKVLENNKIYWEIFPMILFQQWATPAQIFKLENKYYLRPISANLTKDDSVKLGYNPIKMRRSYSYIPVGSNDVLSIEPVLSTKIVGETIEKEPTVYRLKLKDDKSFTHYYFDYSTDGQIF